MLGWAQVTLVGAGGVAGPIQLPLTDLDAPLLTQSWREGKKNAKREGVQPRGCGGNMCVPSRRQIGFGVQRPSGWQERVGLPTSMKPERQAYLTTEPTHQSLPYTTPLESTSGRPQFTETHKPCSVHPRPTRRGLCRLCSWWVHLYREFCNRASSSWSPHSDPSSAPGAALCTPPHRGAPSLTSTCHWWLLRESTLSHLRYNT